MAGDLLGASLGAAHSKWPGADFATVATASFVVAASVGWAAHKRRRRRRQQLVGLGATDSGSPPVSPPPATTAGQGHGWQHVGNVGGQRSTAPHAVNPPLPRGSGCACGSRALGAHRRMAWAVGLLEVLRVLLASLLRQLFCQRYRGPQAHPVSPAPHYAYAVADAVGRRAYMEDRHFAAGRVGGCDGVSVYGVYDGHAGPAAAE